jgi:hypothetical protein
MLPAAALASEVSIVVWERVRGAVGVPTHDANESDLPEDDTEPQEHQDAEDIEADRDVHA